MECLARILQSSGAANSADSVKVLSSIQMGIPVSGLLDPEMSSITRKPVSI